MTRAYVAGVGAVSSLGATWAQTWEALCEGACGIAPITHFDTQGFQCRSAASVVGDWNAPEDRRLTLALSATAEAWAQADLPRDRRVGIFYGAESGRSRFRTGFVFSRAGGAGEALDHAAFASNAPRHVDEIHPANGSAASVARALAHTYEVRGPVMTISQACASGTAAIGEAVRALRAGLCDVAICGGVGTFVDPVTVAAFDKLGALSLRGKSQPFDVHRDGFVLGEGAATLILSADKGALPVEVAGTGSSLDGGHIVAPDEDGAGARRAMQATLDDAGERTVDYVQAHGTSTPLNDAMECAALGSLLPDRPWVSSVKGALGHWISGAGGIGALCAVEAITRGTLLPTVGLEEPDPCCDVQHVIETMTDVIVRSALVNSFGFGGANSSILLRRV